MSKQDVINDVSKFQRACSAYVGREVLYCVSTLIGSLAPFSEQFDYDDGEAYRNLTGGKPDFEEAVSNFILNGDADLDDLEKIMDEFGYWDDFVEEWKEKLPNLVKPYTVVYYDEQGEEQEFNWRAEDATTAVEAFHSEYGTLVVVSVGEDDTESLDEFCEANPEFEKALRLAVFEAVNEQADGYETVCNNHSLEPEYGEIYEHWLVSGYFASQLREHGEVVEEFMNLTIWGRGTTGQSISMDGVVQRIVKDLGEHHWVWQEG